MTAIVDCQRSSIYLGWLKRPFLVSYWHVVIIQYNRDRIGGYNSNYNTLTTAERYNPDTNSWTPIASMGTRRVALGLTAL